MSGELVYSLVARGSVVFAEHTSSTGNFQQITRTILEKLSDHREGKLSYAYDNFIFHLYVDGGIIFLAMASVDYPKKAAFSFLDAVKEQFFCTYANGVVERAVAYELNDFAETLKSRMDYWTANPQDKVDRKLSGIKGEVDEVKNIMVDNISAILDRGDKIELLVDKAEDLGEQANKFKRSGSQLKRKMWWTQFKLYVIICGVFSAFTAGLIGSYCFFSHC